MWRTRMSVALWLIWSMACPVIVHAQGETHFTALLKPNGLNSEGQQRLLIDDAALDLIRTSKAIHRIPVPISPHESLTLSLQRFEVMTASTRWLKAGRSGQESLPAPNIILLRGDIEGQIDSHAFLALTSRGAGSGWFTDAKGRQFQLVADRSDGKPSGLAVQHGPPPLPAFDAVCGTIDFPAAIGGIAGPGATPNNGLRVVSVAVDADQSFTELFESDEEAIAYIAQVVGAVNDIYIRDLNLKLILNFVRIWPDGGEPFSADDLFGFRDYWVGNEDLRGLNLVHLMSGRRDLGYGGIAYLADACDGFGFAISGFLLGGFPAPIAQPDLGTWDVVVVAHEMGHNLGAPHTHGLSPPVDTCASGSDERGTIMSYCHTRPGGLLNIDMRMHVQNQLNIAQNHPQGNCLWYDCNDNGINDLEDLISGFSGDFDGDGIPDECQDCDGDGILNGFEILNGAQDVDSNSIPDACEMDCDGNGKPDRWETLNTPSLDLNGNTIPDTCEADCNGNGIADFIDIAEGTYVDLDRNSGPDICQDCDGNGQPDWIDVGRQHNLYVGQSSPSLREYHALSGVPIQDLGAAFPQGAYDVTFGSDRQLYVANYGAHKITRINLETGATSDFVTAFAGGLSRPTGLTFGPDGHLYTCSQTTSSVLKFDGTTGAPMGIFVAPGTASLTSPLDLVFGPNGNLFVVSSNNRILQFDGVTGAFINLFIDSLTLNGPRSLVFRPSGEVLVTNRTGNNVNRYGPTGAYLGKFNDEYNLQQPGGIALGPNGNVYVASQNNPVRIIEYHVESGRYIRSFIRGDFDLTHPTQFAFRPESENDLDGNNVPDVCDDDPCPADIEPIGQGDGVVDSDDLLLILESWGPCPSCMADIAPLAAGGDNLVDVDDLLVLIASWGSCPK